jgi:hemerythrin-like domain-containing protein
MNRNSATAALRQEHRLILQVVAAFERIIRARAPATLPPDAVDDIEQCITFFRLFTDACHHGKEEDILFAALQEQDVPGVAGHIALMRDEHVQGRLLVRRMSYALAAARADAEEGDDAAEAYRVLADAGAAYIDFIRAHISKEDEGLFDAADSAVHGAACASLCDAYDTVCTRRFDGRSVQDLEALAQRLIERSRVGPPTSIHPY